MHLPFDGGGPEGRAGQFLQTQDTAAGIKNPRPDQTLKFCIWSKRGDPFD